MKKSCLFTAFAALVSTPAIAQDEEPQGAPSPNQIVAEAPANDWIKISPENLLIMRLAPDRDGNARQVIIQLMPPPFSQGWVDNIRTFARAGWYDNISVNRVQDNYVVQWGDPNYDNPEAEGEPKKLPDGLKVMSEQEYQSSGDDLADVEHQLHQLVDAQSQSRESEIEQKFDKAIATLLDPHKTEVDHQLAVKSILQISGLDSTSAPNSEPLDLANTKSEKFPEGWHQRDSYASWVEMYNGWPLANFEHFKPISEATEEEIAKYDVVTRGNGSIEIVFESYFWPIHCYGMVGVGRGYSPDTGSGAELYTVIGHAPRHLDRNIALVGRIVEGMENLSSLPRGKGVLGFYEDPSKRTPILSVRVASDLPEAEQPQMEYLSTESATFAKYAEARANRRDPFFIVPAGGADVCNIPVPIRRVPVSE